MNWYKTATNIKEVINNTSPNDRIFMTNEDSFNFRDQSSNQANNFKPKGLWYACGNGWLEFVMREFQTGQKKNIFQIEINPSSMLIINNSNDFVKFSNEYKVDYNGFDNMYIDWSLVAQEYSGIEISPYMAQFRMDDRHMWYYSWDVASGCIWSNDGIVDVELIHSGIEPIEDVEPIEDDEDED